jgi:hypothetical protein
MAIGNRVVESDPKGRTLDQLLEAQRQQVELLRALKIRSGEQTGGAIGGAFGGAVGRKLGEELGGAAVKLKLAFEGLEGAFQKTTAGMARFVALASPGTMTLFNLAVRDTAATLGQTLQPVMELATKGLRLFGDILMTILPGAGEMKDALEPVADFLNVLRDALAPVAAVLHDVIIVALKAFGVALNIVLLPVRFLAALLNELFGGGGEKAKLKSSVGAAVRQVSFTSPEAATHSVYAAALQSGGPAAPKGEYHGPLEGIANTLDSINEFVRGIRDFTQPIRDAIAFIKGIVADILAALPGAHATPGVSAEAAGAGAGGLAGGLGGGIPGWMKRTVEGANEAAREQAEGPPMAPLWRKIAQSMRRAIDGHPGGGGGP